MEITYDEYVATWQSPEAKEDLDAKISTDARQRYESRMRGAGTNPQARTNLMNMSQEEFESLRSYQMAQLFNAYKNSQRGHSHDLLGIGVNATDENQVRRVVGDRPGYIYNDGILALDYDTIAAINHLAGIGRADDTYSRDWTDSLNYGGLEKIVDEMIATRNILIENTELSYEESMGDKIYRETDIAKRAIGKAQYQPQDELYQTFNKDRVGVNCFRIDDYELSWNQLMERTSSVWAKTAGKLFKFLDEKINPQKARNDKDRIGNKTIEIPENIGGER